jgi:hypothetical protein
MHREPPQPFTPGPDRVPPFPRRRGAGDSAQQRAYGLIWIVAAVGFGATLFALVRRDAHRVESGSNRALNTVWSAVGICIFCVWISLWLASSRRGVNCEALPARPTTSPAGDSP